MGTFFSSIYLFIFAPTHAMFFTDSGDVKIWFSEFYIFSQYDPSNWSFQNHESLIL